MKPEQLLDPETLPEDLRWLVSDFKLAPKDPVFLLIAWHWHRVQQAEDSLRAANVELQTAVDSRVETIAEAAEATASLTELLGQVQAALEQKPALISAQVDAELKPSLEKLRGLEQSLESLLQSARESTAKVHRREILAALLIGIALGVLCATTWLLA